MGKTLQARACSIRESTQVIDETPGQTEGLV
jgi:hypothetical protein